MAWPQPTDYNEAIQNPRSCFRDPELQTAQVVADDLGMPRPYSGNFADVYHLRGPNGQSWAVKCFTREVVSLQSRYQAISHHLQQGSPPFMVQFQYLPEGIRIGGQWYPIVKMDWVEGFTVNEFVRQHADKPLVMYRLAKMWGFVMGILFPPPMTAFVRAPEEGPVPRLVQAHSSARFELWRFRLR